MDLDSILDQALLDFEAENRLGFSTASSSSSKHLKPLTYGSTPQNDPDAKEKSVNRIETTIVDSVAPPTTSKVDESKANNLPIKYGETAYGESSERYSNSEQLMDEVLQKFDTPDEREDCSEAIDGVMQQLLSKDLMYEPTKLVCERYPVWLAAHNHELSEEQYSKYTKQFQTFQRLANTYESEPDNYSRILELMFDLQEQEQPPPEIIQGIAPGLKFDENGIPAMSDFDANLGIDDDNLEDLASKVQSGQCSLM